MRIHLVSSFAALAAVVTLTAPSLATAQVVPAGDSANFLVTGIASAPASQSSGGGGGGGGIGFGVKGGWLYNSFDAAQQSLDGTNGWEAGIFFGGNRNGVVGVMGELLYAKKTVQPANNLAEPTDLYYLEIPILLRLNIGSSNKNKGAIFYGLAGPVFDVNLKAKQVDLDVKDNYEDLDVGILFGGGVEISRFILEGRFNWGLMNILKTSISDAEIKGRSFALLVGVRIN
jgi:hypothetical protein